MERTGLITRMQAFLIADDRVRAAWLGGSDATDRVDGRSDIDLVIVSEPGMVEPAFELFAAWFTDLVGIRRHHRLPDPTVHGHPQALFHGEGLSDDLAVDLMVMHTEVPVEHRFLEVERHGRVKPLVDRLGWLAETVRVDPESRSIEIDRHLDSIAGMHPFQHPLVEKSITRGHSLEAIDAYQRRLLRPLCDLMRIEHDPDRFDFGFRYLDRDLPDIDRELLEHLAFVADLETLRERAATCRMEIERRLVRLNDARPGLARRAGGTARPADRR